MRFFLLCFLSAMISCKQESKSNLPIEILSKQLVAIDSFSHDYKLWAFLAPGCPLSEASLLDIQQFHERNLAVDIVVVIPGKLYSVDEVYAFKDSFAIPFTIVRDTALFLEKKFNVEITPEFILSNQGLEVFYQGAMNDRARELGVLAEKVEKHYLDMAIADLKAGRVVGIRKTKPVGCFIEH